MIYLKYGLLFVYGAMDLFSILNCGLVSLISSRNFFASTSFNVASPPFSPFPLELQLDISYVFYSSVYVSLSLIFSSLYCVLYNVF